MSPPEPKTQISLLKRLADSPYDSCGWDKFVTAYGPLIFEWCRRKGLQEHDARDLTQEVLLTWARQAARFSYDPTRTFRGYLRQLTHAAWCDWVERQRPWHRGSGDTGINRLLNKLSDRDDLVTRLERDFDQERLELIMRNVRGRVNSHTWEAFRLLALDGVSGDEAAARLGMRRGSAFAARCKVQRMIRLELARCQDTESRMHASLCR